MHLWASLFLSRLPLMQHPRSAEQMFMKFHMGEFI
jgi:hypothetical protein